MHRASLHKASDSVAKYPAADATDLVASLAYETRLMCPADLPQVKATLETEIKDTLYGVPKQVVLTSLADHLVHQPFVNFVAMVDGAYAGHLLGGVTLRGMIHHLYVAPTHRRKGIATQLVRDYLKALAGRARVRRTNLVYPSGSVVEGLWPKVGHTLPVGERLVWTDVQSFDFTTELSPLPSGYEVRAWHDDDDVFSFWNGGGKDIVARSVFAWEEAYREQMTAFGASTLATFQGQIVAAVCIMTSWRVAGIYHLKVAPEHRHVGLWLHMLQQSLKCLRDLEIYRVHGSGEHGPGIFRFCSCPEPADDWTFVQADLNAAGEAVSC